MKNAICIVAAAAAALLAAGCGSAVPHAAGSESPVSVPAASLDTTLATAAGTWAAVEMGGSAAQHNNFWELFIRPAGASQWKLVTPPGTADNGGLVLAASASQSVITAFRPSQDLTYTPLTQTRDDGRAWSAVNPLDAPLADTPDALALQPAGGGLLALLTDGTARAATVGSAAWKTVATVRTVAATPAGRRCGLQALTGASYTRSGVALLAGTCAHPGTAGVFARSGGTWQAAGPAIPAALAGQQVRTLRLTTSADRVIALLAVGSGRTASLLAAWSDDNGGRWALSPPLQHDGSALRSASFGPAGTVAVITDGGKATMITSGASQWQSLPALPASTVTLAPGTGGRVDAMAVDRSTLTIWQLAPGGGGWTKAQVIRVPIQFGSSS